MSAVDETAGSAVILAVIDVGSNSIRMAVAQALPDGSIDALERVQRPVRLGQDTFAQGRLSQETMEAATAILRDYRRVLDTYSVSEVRAVATSAVREASNADAFLDRVFMATGLDIEVIDPSEESELTVGAVLHAVSAVPRLLRIDSMIVDVGGGNTLLTLLHRGEISSSTSHRLGAIRLQEILATAEESPRRAARLMSNHIATLVATIRGALPLAKVRGFVAVGGDARFAAAHIGKRSASAALSVVGIEDFDALVKDCAGRTTEELARTHSLEFADAETLTPALLVYQALLHETRARQMIVSDVSMRDGLVLALARSLRGEEDAEHAPSVLQSARSVAERYHYDEKHAQHVADLAVRLFDELRSEHGLGSKHRLLLRVAGILHEVGTYVSARSHHKHSYYLVSNSEIFGLRRRDLAIVAHVARYHRRSVPRPTHLDYMGLTREDRMTVSKLAAILRVADSLDRSHSQQVRDIEFERRPNELIIHVSGVADLGLERLALETKGDLFHDIYGRRVRLEEADLNRPAARTAGPAGEL